MATWNVNSIRSRIDRVEAWLERSDCDVLAIQETKANDSRSPCRASTHSATRWPFAG
jgi:exodeoxyribonuclease-3